MFRWNRERVPECGAIDDEGERSIGASRGS